MKSARNILRMIMVSTLVAALCSVVALAATTNYNLYTFKVWVTADGHSTGTDIGKADSWYVLGTYGTANGTQLRLKDAGDNQYYIQAWYALRGGQWVYLYIFDGSDYGSGFNTAGGKYYIDGSGPENVSIAKWTLKNGSFYTTVGSTEYVLYIDYNKTYGRRPFRLSTNKNHPQRANYNAMTLSPHVHTAGTAVQQNKVAATCTTDGSYDQVVKCSGCGAEMSRSTITVTAGGHNWVDADCDTPKTCSVCKETEGTSLDHSFTAKSSGVLASNATCTEAATYYVQCDNCSAVSDKLTVPVGEAAGHSWEDATCTTPKTCSICGETEGNALDHDWNPWQVTQAPTYILPGEESRTCRRCGEPQNQPIAPTGQATADNIRKEQDEGSITLDGVPEDMIVLVAAYRNGQLLFVQVLDAGAIRSGSVPENVTWDTVKVLFVTADWIPVARAKEYFA